MDPSPYTPLSRRPQAITVSVKELIAKVSRGEVRIPSFQRPLRWTNADVQRLFDSVWRGYPVGSLLFWKRRADASIVSVGGAHIDAPEMPDAWWVVDGQQRTTALSAALLELDHQHDKRWTLAFDPSLPGFVGPTARFGDEAVPVSVLGDLRRLGRWIRDRDLPEEVADLIEETQQRLLDYTIPAYVVETDEEEALRAVFARLNSSGARMRADEVFQALLGAPSKGQSSLDLNALQVECSRNEFGTPPRADVFKAVLAMGGVDPTKRPQDLPEVELDRLPSFDTAAEALSRTTEFFQDQCGIAHVRLIPYTVVFVILARFFYVHRDPHPATLARLAQWVWRGASNASHYRAEVSKMRLQVRAIDGDDEQASLDGLMEAVGEPGPAKWELRAPFDGRSARSRIEMLALLDAHPSDRNALRSLAEVFSGDRIAREVITLGDAKKFGLDDKVVRSAANRVILDTVSSGLRTELRTWDPIDDQAALRSHLISAEAFEALRANDFATFLQVRADTLVEHISTFLDSRAQWEAPIVRPPRYYADDLVVATEPTG